MTPPLLALVGPTASGKTAAALALAAQAPIEIISMDSALVFRGMDIGTAKPTPEERAAVPHHLIDILDPAQTYSVARFLEDVQQHVHAIRARQHLPVLVGGTMMYLNALRQGIDDLPAADANVRARLEEEKNRLGLAALHARLFDIDPASAARLHPTDSQRILRALEIHLLTGQAMSTLLGQRASRSAPPMQIISLEPGTRSWLHERIAQRFDAMLAHGFLDEVRALKARPDLHAELPSIRSVGYRQAWAYLNGEGSAADMRERGIIATRQLAKRQITWLRSMPDRTLIDCTHPHAAQHALEALLRTLHTM